MVLNYIWIAFFIIAFVVALIKVIGFYFRDFFAETIGVIFDVADFNVFSDIMASTWKSAGTSIELCIWLIGVMALWLGIMKIGEKGGAVNGLARIFGPFFSKLFPEIPKNHPVFGSIIMNFSANMLGLDNAATPLGLKAMEQLQEVNKDKTRASNSMIMFLVLNTSGLTIIPISVMALRASEHAAFPTDIFLPILIATYCASMVGLLAVAIRQRIFSWILVVYLSVISALIGGIVLLFANLEQSQIAAYSSLIANFVLFAIIIVFFLLAIRKKVNLYEAFIEGAKEGFNVAVKIIPYLVAMLVAIGVFRASGAMDMMIGGIKHLVLLFTERTEWVDTLPVALMKPLSGSGARGAMVEAWQHFGVDSLQGKIAATLQGSTETTFYTIAVYFGAIGIKKTRYTASFGLLADLAGIIAAIIIAYMFFAAA